MAEVDPEVDPESKFVETLPWHVVVLDQLENVLSRGRLPNAIALVCPTGWGLASLSERVVQIVAELDPEQIPSQLAPQDVRWIEPEGGG